jgi:predicted component of type VI protein secretion system
MLSNHNIQYKVAWLLLLHQDTQDLIQKMLSDLFQERPADIIQYMSRWLEAEKKRRDEKEQEQKQLIEQQ